MKKRTLITASLIAGTLLASAGVSWLTCRLSMPVVAAFNMKSTVDAFFDSASRRSLDEAQTKALSERFNASLEASLRDWQVRHRGLILVSPAVVQGAPDITREIQTDVARRMKEGGVTRALALSLMLLSSVTAASDLGTWGDLWPVAEPDMLTVIEGRLQALQQSGEMDKKMGEFRERVVRNSQRPPPVAGITRAMRYEKRWFDPSVRVDRDLADGHGNVFARAGQVFNPLEVVPFNQTLLFIDGDDRDQLAWARRQKPATLVSRIILVKGNIPQTSEALDSRIFFDQNGALTARFGISQVPARVTAAPSGQRLQVEIIPPEMTKYDAGGTP